MKTVQALKFNGNITMRKDNELRTKLLNVEGMDSNSAFSNSKTERVLCLHTEQTACHETKSKTYGLMT